MLKDRTARGAGDVFKMGDKLIRPAQINNDQYGEGLVFQEVIINNDNLTLKEVNRIKPPKGAIGLHTFNSYKGIYVVDFKLPRYPLIYKIKSLYKFFRR